MRHADLDRWHMARALGIAARGRGHVEPNPLVGCLITRGAEIIGEGWHRRYGGPHAEIEALAIAGDRARGSTMYVTLEPCCHHGKTPPCTQAILASGISRVVAAQLDPFPAVSGQGLAELAARGVETEVGVLDEEARWLNAPYLKLVHTGRPWVIAKWAMTLDGKIASRTGDSQWISSEESRAIVHELRGKVDAILVGRGTVETDDPRLTARPAGPRVATRVVLDNRARLGSQCQLVRSIDQAAVLVAASAAAPPSDVDRLRKLGCELFCCPGTTQVERLTALLVELGRRRMTNVLVEGGSQVLGTLLDGSLIDEVHVFIAPVLLGGVGAKTAVGGSGFHQIAESLRLDRMTVRQVGGDVYLHGQTRQTG